MLLPLNHHHLRTTKRRHARFPHHHCLNRFRQQSPLPHHPLDGRQTTAVRCWSHAHAVAKPSQRVVEEAAVAQEAVVVAAATQQATVGLAARYLWLGA